MRKAKFDPDRWNAVMDRVCYPKDDKGQKSEIPVTGMLSQPWEDLREVYEELCNREP